MKMDESFGELRSLLALSPSVEVWTTLCGLLEGMADEDADQFGAEVLPYVQVALEPWPEHLRVPMQGWIEATAVIGDHPCLPIVRWLASGADGKQDSGSRKRLVQAPGLGHLRTLHLEPVTRDLSMMRGAPMTRSLHTLDLGGIKLKAPKLRFLEELDALRALSASSPSGGELISGLERWGRLPTLEVLQLSASSLDAAHVAPLAQCGAMRELALWSNHHLEDSGVEAICASGALQTAPLEHLNLGGCNLTHASVLRLSRAPWWLKRLLLWDNKLSVASLELLADHPAFAHLELLNISSLGLGGDALAALFAAPRRALKELWVSRTPALGVESWRACGGMMSGLRVLRAENAGLDVGFEAEEMVTTLMGGQVEELYLASNKLGAAQMSAMAKARLPALRRLDITHNGIGDEGLEALLAAPWATQLEALNVGSCGLETGAFAAFARHAHRLGALRHLSIGATLPAGPSITEQLRDLLPQVIFSWV